MSQSRPSGAPERPPRARPLSALRASDVRFVREGVDLVEPFSLAIPVGETATLEQPTPFAASLAARLCGAIVRPTSGTIFVGDYETRLQPPQAKRRVGFVDAAGFLGDAHTFACEVAFRAECWNLDRAAARDRATSVLAAFAIDALAIDGSDAREAAYARAVALALVADVSLVVLDRPPPSILDRTRSLANGASLLVTRVRGA